MQYLSKKIIAILILFSSVTQAKESHLTCSIKNAIIHYVNGVQVYDPDENNQTVELMRLHLGQFDVDEKGVTFAKPTWNSTYSIKEDVYDSVYLRLRNLQNTNWSPRELEQNTNWIFLARDRFVRAAQQFITLGFAKELAEFLSRNTKLPTGGQITKLAEMIKEEINSGHKIVLVGHSAGTMFSAATFEEVKDLLSNDQKKIQMFAGVMLAAALPYLPETGNGESNFTYVRTSRDLVIGTIAVGALAANVETNFLDNLKYDPFGHGVTEIYLNESIIAEYKERPISMSDLFVLKVKEAVSAMINNDAGCCDGRAGKLWLNEINCREQTCLGGFIEETISHDRSSKSLSIDRNAKVCANPAHMDGVPRILGNVDLKGNILLGDSAVILGGSTFSSPITIDSLDSEIELRGTTVVRSEMGYPLKIKGAILATGNTQLSGRLDITGETYQGNSNQSYKTAFVDAKISGFSEGSKIQGPVLISGNVQDSEIVGVRDQYNSTNNWNILNIDSDAEVKDAKISGIGTIGATVKDNATISGNKIQERLDGVVLLNGNGAQEKTIVSGDDTKITGLVYVKNARILNDSFVWGKYAYGPNSSIAIQGVDMNHTRVVGAGNLGSELTLSDSIIDGCGWFVQYTQIINSQLYGSRFVNYPLTNQQLGELSDVETSCAGGISVTGKSKSVIEGGADYNRQKLATLFANP